MGKNKQNDKKESGQKDKRTLFSMRNIIIGVCVCMVLSAVIFWLFMGGNTSEPSLKVDAEPPEKSDASVDAGYSNIFSLGSYVVNLKDSGGNRFLKVFIKLELSETVLKVELKQRAYEIRDLLIIYLSGKSMDEVQTSAGKISLRNGMIKRINQRLKTGKIKNLYFTEFIVQ